MAKRKSPGISIKSYIVHLPRMPLDVSSAGSSHRSSLVSVSFDGYAEYRLVRLRGRDLMVQHLITATFSLFL